MKMKISKQGFQPCFFFFKLSKKTKSEFENQGQTCYIVERLYIIYQGFLFDEQIDFICTHPPYANIIEYSEDIADDISHCNVSDFLVQMEAVAKESFRVLKKGKFCAVLMGDTRHKGHMIPMSFDVMKIFENCGFKLKELIIKEQHNCKATGYWKTNSVKYNFLLIAHEYLFIFRKP